MRILFDNGTPRQLRQCGGRCRQVGRGKDGRGRIDRDNSMAENMGKETLALGKAEYKAPRVKVR